MTSSHFKDWNDSPFGRSLHVLAHRLPRQTKQGLDWEIERGFQLNILGFDFFEFTLASRTPEPELSLPLLTSPRNPDQVAFLVWHCPGRYDPNRFQEFSSRLQSSDVQIGLVLSHSRERSQALLDYPKFRKVWNPVQKPVIQVFQNFPEADYFSVEKCLFDLGRVGRRLTKLSRLRRLMPW